MATSAPVVPAAPQIPVDLFVSKKHPGLARGELGFVDSSGNLVFRANRISSKRSPYCKWVVVDESGTPLFSALRQHNGSWKGFKGDGEGEKDAFRVQTALNKFYGSEFDVFLVKDNSEESTSDFKVKGCAFQRSCIIYGGNVVVAQVSIVYYGRV